MEVDCAYDLIVSAMARGRAAHAYLLAGGVTGDARHLADKILVKLFGDGNLAVHPDIHRLAPEKKTRVISAEAMRVKMVSAMAQTSFSGGWKVGIIESADRLHKESANAFLKTLEEPPPKTMFLLLTEHPESILPTILSRCQQIYLNDLQHVGADSETRRRILAILADPGLNGMVERMAAAGRITALFTEAREQIADRVADEAESERVRGGEDLGKDILEARIEARYRAWRQNAAAVILSWFRDLTALVTGGETVPLENEDYVATLESRATHLVAWQAFRNMEAVEKFASALEKNVPDVLETALLMDRLKFGTEGT